MKVQSKKKENQQKWGKKLKVPESWRLSAEDGDKKKL